MGEITIKFKDREATIETAGFKGPSCMEAVKFLKSLGEEKNSVLLASYYENEEQTETIFCG